MSGTDAPDAAASAGAAGPTSAVTASPDATRAVGAALASVVRPGDVVVLAGDLGAGKTTLTQGFAAALGVVAAVTSPTFALVRPYACGPGSPGGVRTILHADVYRLDHLSEIADLGLVELLEDDAVALVEWGDAAVPVLGDEVLHVRIDPGDADSERRITVTPRGEQWAARASAVADALGRVADAPGRAADAPGRVADAPGRAADAPGRVAGPTEEVP